MDVLLAIATILGGIAALWYFWDKIRGFFGWAEKASATAAASAPVAPPDPVEKWVDFNYPHDSGLQARLEAEGYQIAWCLDTKLARRIDLEGWQVVVEPDAQGVLSKFRLADRPADQTLVKKPVP